MSKTIKFSVSLTIFLMLIMPAFSSAAEGGLVKCGRDVYQVDTEVGGVKHLKGEIIQCNFKDAMTLVNTIITFILFSLVLPVSAIMFAYAGFKLVTSGGSTEARSKAKSIFTSALIGLVIAAAAWLIIRTILSILGYDGAWIGF
jgi:hypothetical protein